MKSVKKVTALCIALVMLLSFSGCCVSTSDNGCIIPPWVNFEEARENYVPSFLEQNEFTLTVGERYRPLFAKQAQLGGWLCGSATDDESIVTVAKDGTLVAVSPGTAYVFYWSPLGTDAVLITVEQDPMLSVPEEETVDTETRIQQALDNYNGIAKKVLFVGETTGDFRNETIHIVDESIACVDENGNLKGLRQGVTYVVELSEFSHSVFNDTAYQIVVKDISEVQALFEEKIDNFDEVSFLSKEELNLIVGETEMLYGAHLLIADESVVQGSVDGGITAVGKGMTYVMTFHDDGTMGTIYKVTVK